MQALEKAHRLRGLRKAHACRYGILCVLMRETLFVLNRLATNADSTLLADGPPFHPFYRGCPVPCALCKARAREASRTANRFHLRSLNAHRAEAILRCQRPPLRFVQQPSTRSRKRRRRGKGAVRSIRRGAERMGRAGASLNLCLGRALMFSTRTPDQTEGPP